MEETGGGRGARGGRCTLTRDEIQGPGALDDIHDCVVMIYRLWADDIHRARRGDGDGGGGRAWAGGEMHAGA